MKSTNSGTPAEGLLLPPTPVINQDSLLENSILSPLTDLQAWFWTPLPPPDRQSVLAFCCSRDGGWVHAGHTCIGEHAQCRGAPTCGPRLCSLSPHPPLLKLCEVQEGRLPHTHKNSPCMLYAHSGGPETQWMYTRQMTSRYYYTQGQWSLLRRSSKTAQIIFSLNGSTEER